MFINNILKEIILFKHLLIKLAACYGAPLINLLFGAGGGRALAIAGDSTLNAVKLAVS